MEDVQISLPRLLAELPKIDFFLHDDLHIPPHVAWELNEVWPKLTVGGVMVADDINSAWLRFCCSLERNGVQPDLNLQRLGVVFKR